MDSQAITCAYESHLYNRGLIDLLSNMQINHVDVAAALPALIMVSCRASGCAWVVGCRQSSSSRPCLQLVCPCSCCLARGTRFTHCCFPCAEAFHHALFLRARWLLASAAPMVALGTSRTPLPPICTVALLSIVPGVLLRHVSCCRGC